MWWSCPGQEAEGLHLGNLGDGSCLILFPSMQSGAQPRWSGRITSVALGSVGGEAEGDPTASLLSEQCMAWARMEQQITKRVSA